MAQVGRVRACCVLHSAPPRRVLTPVLAPLSPPGLCNDAVPLRERSPPHVLPELSGGLAGHGRSSFRVGDL